jgi:hypothetical protein
MPNDCRQAAAITQPAVPVPGTPAGGPVPGKPAGRAG